MAAIKGPGHQSLKPSNPRPLVCQFRKYLTAWAWSLGPLLDNGWPCVELSISPCKLALILWLALITCPQAGKPPFLFLVALEKNLFKGLSQGISVSKAATRRTDGAKAEGPCVHLQFCLTRPSSTPLPATTGRGLGLGLQARSRLVGTSPAWRWILAVRCRRRELASGKASSIMI